MSSKNNSNITQHAQLMLRALNHPDFLKELPLLIFDKNSSSSLETIDPITKIETVNLSGTGTYTPSLANHMFGSPLLLENTSIWSDRDFQFMIGYNSNIDLINNKDSEILSLILYFCPTKKPIGNVKLTITRIKRELNVHTVDLHIDYISVKNISEQRSVYYLNLIGAILSFFDSLIKCMLLLSLKNDRFELRVNKKFKSKSGGKIGKIVFNELDNVIKKFANLHTDEADYIVTLNSKKRKN